MEFRERLGGIDKVTIVPFVATEVLSPQPQAQVARVLARAVAKSRWVRRRPGITLVIHHRARDLGVVAP
jgi:hypothetical protein